MNKWVFAYLTKTMEVGIATIHKAGYLTPIDILQEIPNVLDIEFLAMRPTEANDWTDIRNPNRK